MSDTARRLWHLYEPIHAVQYFCAEPIAALKDAGYRGYWMGYFAGRAAPLGAVGPDLVHAVFYNFPYAMVSRALPDAWTFAPPVAALQARQDGSVAALRRIAGDAAADATLARAADLALLAATGADGAGRPLYAANRSLPVPDEPLARLWHAVTMLREHRGDGHIAALMAHGIDGREAHVLASVSRGIPRETYRRSRNLDDEQWAATVARLHERGLLTTDGALSEAGGALVETVETTTDELAATQLDGLTPAEVDELSNALRPLTRAVATSGEIPLDSPMGLDLRDV